MRSDLKGRHWMDRRVLGDRAAFVVEKTGAYTNTGAEIHRAFLRIENLLLEDAGPYRSEFLALKHESMIPVQSCNPVCGFSITEQVRLCAVWLGPSMNKIQGWKAVRICYHHA